MGFDRIEDLDDALPERIEREDLPWDAAFLAAGCFVQYRRLGGTVCAEWSTFSVGSTRCPSMTRWLPATASSPQPSLPPAVNPRSRTMDLLIAATAHAHSARLYTRNAGNLSGLEHLVNVVPV